MGGEVLLRLLIGVDVVIGPLITLIIFDTRKPRLNTTCCDCRVANSGTRVRRLRDVRCAPRLTVFVVDRFSTVPANSVDQESLARPRRFRSVATRWPAHRRRAQAGQRRRVRPDCHVINGRRPDIQPFRTCTFLTPRWRPRPRVAKPLVTLAQKGKEPAELVNAFVSVNGRAGRSLGFVPVRARNRDFAVVVDRKTGEIVGYLSVDPW
jgi:hypothetical protein